MTPGACLLYVDPSPRGEWALAMAALLPRAAVSSWTLLATAEDLEQDPQLLARAAARLPAAGAPVHEARLPGPAEAAVVREASARPYELVVVPPAGRNAVQRMLRGSRVATVVRRVPSSVLVARRPPVRIERVLAAASGRPRSRAVIRAAVWLASAWGAQATVLHVAPEVALPFQPQGGAAGAGAVDPPDLAADVIRRELGEAAAEVPVIVQEGLVADQVLEEVENGAYHLLAVGGPTPGGAPWAEDVVERILVHCPTSVLVVRPGLDAAGGG